MSFVNTVLGLFEAGQAAQATAYISAATVTPDMVDDLQAAADHLEEEQLAVRLRSLSEQLQESFSSRPEETDRRQLQTNLAVLFQEMDGQMRSKLAAKLKNAANKTMIQQTLAEMMREGRMRELGTLLSQQSLSGLRTPAFLRAHFALSLEQADMKAARHFAEIMIDAQPHKPEGYLCRAEWAYAHGDLNEAKASLAQAQRLAEATSNFYSLSIRIHLVEGLYHSAAAELRQWIAQGSEQTAAERWYLIGLVKENYPGFDDDSMTAALEEACRLSPQRADYWLALAKAYLREAKNGEAIEVFQKIHTLDSINPRIWQEFASLELCLGSLRMAVPSFEKSARLFNRQVEALVPAGLGLIAAFVRDDLDQATALELLLRDIAVYHEPALKNRPLMIPKAIQNFHKVREEWRRANPSAIGESALRFGSALLPVFTLVDPLLPERATSFLELAWKMGEDLFGTSVLDPVIHFLWTRPAFPSKAPVPVIELGQSQRWSGTEETNILESLRLAFLKADYQQGAQLARQKLARSGTGMKKEDRDLLEQWFFRHTFYWAFENTSAPEEDVKNCLSDFRKLTTDIERLSYMQMLARRYDGKGFSGVGDRLLTLSELPEWKQAKASRQRN